MTAVIMLLKYFIKIHLFFFIFIWVTACQAYKNNLDVRQLPRYSSTSDCILFLTFNLSAKGTNEKVELANATANAGKVKNILAPVHGANNITAIVYYQDTKEPTKLIYPHPLYQTVEIPDKSGTISTHSLETESGTLFIRLQANANIDRLELYSTRTKHASKLIYQLKFKL